MYKNILYVDIGNTTIKFGFQRNKEFILWRSYNVKEKLKLNELTRLLEYHKIDLILYSSVRLSKDSELIQLSKGLNVKIIDIKTLTLKPYFNFLDKKFIGSDLMCLVAASCALYNSDSIIISLGTATTISVVVNNKYLGSIIMPGLGIATKSLFESAELLKEFDVSYIKDYKIKKDTKNAINLGTINSLEKLINCWVDDLKDKYDTVNFNVIITGGYLNKFENNFNNFQKNSFLVFEGLLFYLKNNNLYDDK